MTRVERQAPLGRRWRRVRSARAWWVWAALLTPTGCGVLDTREPEDPINAIEIPYQTPDEPLVVLENIEASLEAKSTINYETSLLDDFRFLPADIDAADFPSLWTKTGEEIPATDAFLNDFLGETGSVTLTWTIPDETLEAGQSDQGERQVYYQDLAYRLDFQIGQLTRTYTGECDLYFRETGAGNLWAIYEWQDKEDGSGNSSWGRLRIDRRVIFL